MSSIPLLPRELGKRLAHRRIHRARIRSAFLAAAALSATLYCLCWTWFKPEQPLSRVHFHPAAHWISTQCNEQATGCFRLDLDLPGTVVNAYITIASNGGFEVTANGVVCSQSFLWRPTRPFQNGLSESGQRLYSKDIALAVNFPREYQWSDHNNAALPVWMDLRPFLHRGPNALCVEVEVRSLCPAFIVQGEIELASGDRIPIRSDETWHAEPVPTTIPQEAWTSADQSVRAWHSARLLNWSAPAWRTVSADLYQIAFRGERLRVVPEADLSWFRQTLMIGHHPKEAFIRLVTDQPFQIFVNGRRIQVPYEDSCQISTGPWLIHDRGRTTLAVAPERLDSDEVGTLLPGRRYENPRHGDPPKSGLGLSSETLNSSTHDYRDGAEQQSTVSMPAVKRRLPDDHFSIEKPEPDVLPSITADRRTVAFVAYRIEALLHPGPNEIRIGVYDDRPSLYGLSWAPLLAFDGAVIDSAGHRQCFSSNALTECAVANGFQGSNRWMHAVSDGLIQPALLPGLTYLGWAAWPQSPGVAAGAGFPAFAVVFLILNYRFPWWRRWLSRMEPMICTVTVGLVAVLFLHAALIERSEIIYWRLSWMPLAAVTVAWLLGLLVYFLTRRRVQPAPGPSGPGGTASCNRWCSAAFTGALALCFFLRAWNIDYQPPEVDEYASIQAALAIAEKGVPEYASGAWYTRSPLYHYLAGGVARLTNGGIYSLRLLSVAFACATCALLGRWLRELTGSHLLAFSGMLLYAVHPYLIYIGYMARFYQQQQFFELLCCYLFIRGFVLGATMRIRYLTLACFLAAALSQEIGLLHLVPLGLCYVLLARTTRWPNDVRVLVAGGCVLALLAVDIAFSQIRGLTSLEGVSPRVEPTLGWTFQTPSSFFSLLIGYSRLQLFLSAFLLGGALLALQRKSRVLCCLYLYLTVAMCIDNLLITTPTFRYLYSLVPLWLLLSVVGVAEVMRMLLPRFQAGLARTFLTGLILAMGMLSWSPWRLLPSYHLALIGDSTRALQFVAANRRQGDRLAVTEPYPHAALLETGSVDYDLGMPVLYDFVVRRDGLLIDRNGGAKVIGKTSELQRAFAETTRLWIVVDREKMRSRGTDLAWEYPGTRAELYLRKNARLVFRSYLWSVYLWDANAGHYLPFHEDPRSWAE
jgi:hypothetical protein